MNKLIRIHAPLLFVIIAVIVAYHVVLGQQSIIIKTLALVLCCKVIFNSKLAPFFNYYSQKLGI